MNKVRLTYMEMKKKATITNTTQTGRVSKHGFLKPCHPPGHPPCIAFWMCAVSCCTP